MNQSLRVVVIDDEPQIRRALRTGLERFSFKVTLCESGDRGLDEISVAVPDAVILDLAMQGIDGMEVCRQLREWSNVPIIVLSVRDSEDDKIKALELGADDYLTKPFGIRELVARLRAVLRRTSNEQTSESTFFCGGLLIDYTKRMVTRDGNHVRLTPKEYDLLRYMVANVDRVLTHSQLLSKVWGSEFCDDHHTLRVHIANLRNKIERQADRPQFIHTETRIGYRFQSSAGIERI